MSIRNIIESNTYRKSMSILKREYKSSRGSTRITFLDTDQVYKFPLIVEYSRINRQEYQNYLDYHNGLSDVPVADCEIIYTADKVPVIMMERVNTTVTMPRRSMPAWANNVDSCQIGLCKDGLLRAYDYTGL